MQLKEALVFSHNRKSGSYSQLCMKGGEEAAGVVWGRGILFSNDKKKFSPQRFFINIEVCSVPHSILWHSLTWYIFLDIL